MKNLLFFVIVCLLAVGCSSNELSREQAFEMIKSNYPKMRDIEIYIADPGFAKRLLDAGLETDGYVTVQRTQKLADVGEPLVQFTEKAQEFLLPEEKTSESWKKKALLFEEDIVEVTGIKRSQDNTKAVVEYTTKYTKTSPFIALTKIEPEKTTTRKAYFALYDDGWRLEEKPGADFVDQ